MATEYAWGANYPAPVTPNWWGEFVCSELQKAKYVARLSVQHTGLGVGSYFCTVWGSTTYPLDLSLMRRGFNADPFTPIQPQAAYYVMRNLATALDGYRPAKFDYRVEGAVGKIECYTMAREGGRALALWRPGRADDEGAATPMDIRIPGRSQRVSAYDCLNGVEQEFVTHADGNETVVRGICVRDYPILVRVEETQE